MSPPPAHQKTVKIERTTEKRTTIDFVCSKACRNDSEQGVQTTAKLSPTDLLFSSSRGLCPSSVPRRCRSIATMGRDRCQIGHLLKLRDGRWQSEN
mmetsp:Transcript_6905/g.14382  ORF Transcript_6905/g.14382 Transcript_6905/m.14382 type:complete len:96 (-) Transcript_6905:111-398(-)